MSQEEKENCGSESSLNKMIEEKKEILEKKKEILEELLEVNELLEEVDLEIYAKEGKTPKKAKRYRGDSRRYPAVPGFPQVQSKPFRD